MIVHNGGGYAFQFIANYMLQKKQWEPEMILPGNKIIQMSYLRLIFKDSLNFFHTRLAALPKMFAIEDYAKGYFPHFFNTPENYDYSGPLPGKEFYGPDHMSAVEREKFMQWHDDQIIQKKPSISKQKWNCIAVLM